MSKATASTPEVDNTPEVVIPAPIDPMEYIPYKLQRDQRRKNERGRYVGVNNLRVFVPYGQSVMIPRCIAEVLDNSLEQDDITANRIMDLEDKANY